VKQFSARSRSRPRGWLGARTHERRCPLRPGDRPQGTSTDATWQPTPGHPAKRSRRRPREAERPARCALQTRPPPRAGHFRGAVCIKRASRRRAPLKRATAGGRREEIATGGALPASGEAGPAPARGARAQRGDSGIQRRKSCASAARPASNEAKPAPSVARPPPTRRYAGRTARFIPTAPTGRAFSGHSLRQARLASASPAEARNGPRPAGRNRHRRGDARAQRSGARAHQGESGARGETPTELGIPSPIDGGGIKRMRRCQLPGRSGRRRRRSVVTSRAGSGRLSSRAVPVVSRGRTRAPSGRRRGERSNPGGCKPARFLR